MKKKAMGGSYRAVAVAHLTAKVLSGHNKAVRVTKAPPFGHFPTMSIEISRLDESRKLALHKAIMNYLELFSWHVSHVGALKYRHVQK